MAATSANTVYDFASWAKLQNPTGGHVDMIGELLNQINEPTQDLVYLEGNMPTGHQITQRTGLPTTYTRQLNQPVSVSRGQTAQVTEGMSQFQAWAEYDEDLLKLWSEKQVFLYHQSLAFMESMVQAFNKSLIYGDPSTDPTQFLGLAPRYSTVNTANAASAQNVIDGGGTGSVNTSLWLVTWAPYAFHCFFPKGSTAGIEHKVKEDAVVQGTTGIGGTRMWAHQESWSWKVGAALWDWRWCGRLCNIDTTNLKNQAGATDLTEGMIDLMYRMPSISTPASSTGNPTSNVAIPGKQVFYCNRTVRAALHKQMLNKTNNQLSMEDWYGHKVMTFAGIPIRNCDQITNTEAQVT